jgi:pyruvate/2-oxoglutarate dehydrogenase complex dihydrolipoamide dehydrogenase (E3) component
LRERIDALGVTVHFDATVRAIIGGRTFGFCKLVTDRESNRILGRHVVGERAVEITQLAAIAMAARMTVDELARVAISFPTYAEVLVQAAVRAAVALNLPLGGHAEHAALTSVSA